MNVLQTIPVFRIFDLAKAKEFYLEFLEFQLDWEHRFEGVAPIYMQISRSDCVLHLKEHYGDACAGSLAYIRMTGIKEFHAELIGKQYGYLRPGLEAASWGAISMELIDPFGNHLR
ncbi:MAG TPA: glyoxalase superfamily protein, partial [Gemmatales bacterium]|nr:glyoxalase superfamily protein [Gemmatales bacterium]